MNEGLATITIFALLHVPIGASAENISISLGDDTMIYGDLVNTEGGSNSALLLHQCNRDSQMWEPLVDELVDHDFSVMTVDMRGYGKSASGKFDIERHSYNEVTRHFRTDIDHINAFWLRETPDSGKRVVVGASCGGGQATKIATTSGDIAAMVLFSPSLREHWVDGAHVETLAEKKDLPILGIVSEGDENSFIAVQSVFARNDSPQSQTMIYKGDLHGEPLFGHDPSLAKYMADWIDRVVR